LIPFLEIIKNELLANLVAVKETSFDTVDGLLNPKAYILMWGDLDLMRVENEKLVHDSQLRKKLEKLFDKIGKRINAADILKFALDPDKVKRIGRNLVFMSDQYSSRWVEVSKF